MEFTNDLKVLLTAPSGGGKTVLLSSFSKVLSISNKTGNGFYITGDDLDDLNQVYFQMVHQGNWPAPTEIGEFSQYEFQMYPDDPSTQAVPPLVNFSYYDFPGEITTKTKSEIKDEAEIICFKRYREIRKNSDVHIIALDGLKLTALIKKGIRTKDGNMCKAFSEAILNKTKANMAAQLFTALNHSKKSEDGLDIADPKPLLIAITKWDIAKDFEISLEDVRTFLLSTEFGLNDEFMRIPRDVILIPVSVTGDNKTMMNITETGVTINIINKDFTPYNINILFNLVFYTATKAKFDEIKEEFKEAQKEGIEQLNKKKKEWDKKIEEIQKKTGFSGWFGRLGQQIRDTYEKVTTGMTERDTFAKALAKIQEDDFIEKELDKEGKIPYLSRIIQRMEDVLYKNANCYMYIKRK